VSFISFKRNKILLCDAGQSVPLLKAASGSPETPCQDQPAEDEVGRGQGLIQKERSHHGTEKGESVIEDHCSPGSKGHDGSVP
jgi:hypothetical protein